MGEANFYYFTCLKSFTKRLKLFLKTFVSQKLTTKISRCRTKPENTSTFTSPENAPHPTGLSEPVIMHLCRSTSRWWMRRLAARRATTRLTPSVARFAGWVRATTPSNVSPERTAFFPPAPKRTGMGLFREMSFEKARFLLHFSLRFCYLSKIKGFSNGND